VSVAEIVHFKYRAFLSYSHRDKAWGNWLQRALEGYRIDKDLVGRQTPAGPVPKTLRPIFRDRDDFSAGHSLTEQTIAALEASQFLLVLCSPNAARSQYVNEEIRRFKAMGRAARVIPVIVDGEPGSAERECFPAALRFKLGADGTLTGEPEEPIAADAREQGDGKEIAKHKAVAGLLGLGLDEIVRRASRARKRRNRFWATLAVGFLFLAVAASGSAAYAWQQLKTNEAFLNATLKRATEIVDEAVMQAERYNVPRAATLSLLIKAEGLFDDMAQYGRPTPELRYRKAWMLIQFARNYEILGDTDKRFARANEAQRLLAGLAAEKTDDLTYQRDLSVAYGTVGDVLVAQGNLPEALKSFRDGLAIMERLAKADPDNAGWHRDLSLFYNRVGSVLVAQGNLPEALKSFRDGLAIAERLAKAYPDKVGWQADLSIFYNSVGDVLVAQGNLPEALQSHRDSLAIMERVTRAAPDNAGWQSDLSVCYGKVGDVLLAQGNLPEALKSFRNGLAIVERLAKADPSNAGWQRDLTVSYDRVGEVLLAQGNLPEALRSFRDGLAIREHLAKADPKNAGWQRDLSVSYDRVGDLLLAQGNLPEALKSFSDGLAIMERLAKGDPDNAGWQSDLSLSYTKIGHVLAAQGNMTEALNFFRDGLAIAERLVKADPSNVQRLNALQFTISRIGGLVYPLVLAGDFAKALDAADLITALAPDELGLHANRAHALMFIGRVEEARAIYLAHRGIRNVLGEKSWETAVLEDFAELRAARLMHPLMDEIEQLFTARL
jgi:tetratricopeptide (TPR) repeat protein